MDYKPEINTHLTIFQNFSLNAFWAPMNSNFESFIFET